MEAIGRLQVEQTLGSGSFASVWLAYDPDLDSRVAVKVLAENWAANTDMRARFVEEARILRRLEHTRVARVYAIDTLGDGRPYIVMEYADRGSLLDVIKARHASGLGFSVDEAMSTSLELADCVSVAHDLGVIHRDLKPSNILFRTVPSHHQAALRRRGLEAPAEQMLLVDFGLARKFQALTESTVAAGTPHYMAPEQAEGHADARVDVYATAAILYQLLAGEVPFPHSSIGEVIRHQIVDGAPPILDRRPDTPPQLAALVDQSLANDPADRPRSIAEWTEGLKSVRDAFRPRPTTSQPTLPETEAVASEEAPPTPPEPPHARRSSSQPPTEISQDAPLSSPLPPGSPEHSKPGAEAEPESPPGPDSETGTRPGDEPRLDCAGCGEANPADFSFCGECGTPLRAPIVNQCPDCALQNPADFSFCGECGHQL